MSADSYQGWNELNFGIRDLLPAISFDREPKSRQAFKANQQTKGQTTGGFRRPARRDAPNSSHSKLEV
jgi:hypothetical protein